MPGGRKPIGPAVQPPWGDVLQNQLRRTIMNVSRMVLGGMVAVGLLAAGVFTSSAEAAPLVAQPNIGQAVAPAVVGFHRWHGGASYRGCGSYNYGRPSLYYGYQARPHRTVVRYNYRPSYSYGYVSPYVVRNDSYYNDSYYSMPTCVNCSPSPVGYSQPVVYSQPNVYSQQVAYSQPAVYSQPVIYARPAYSVPAYSGGAYSTGFYSRPAYYSGYSSYSYPAYGSVRYGSVGIGYPMGGAYYPGGHW